MAANCDVCGKGPSFGHSISHSHIRTKRRTLPNLHHKRYWVPSENRFVRLRVSCQGMKIIDKRGIEAVLTDLRARGEKI